jgi:hypothetical protein
MQYGTSRKYKQKFGHKMMQAEQLQDGGMMILNWII